MGELSVVSTDGLQAARQRVEFWNDCAVQALRTPLSVNAADPGRFWGRIAHAGLRSLQIAEVSSGAAVVRHSDRHAARMALDAYHILVQLSGKSEFSQGGNNACLSPGDFTLVDCSHSYELAFDDSVANLVITVRRDQLKPYMACPESLAGIKQSGSSGISALASRFLQELWKRPEDFLAASSTPFLERAVLDMVAGSYAGERATSARSTEHALTRRMGLIRYIEEHLCDQELCPESIASAFHVTPRCIYRLFESETDTLAHYIRRRRLEESAFALRNPMLRHRSISSIAFDHGFSSIAHFCKIFRQHYDTSPTEYRKRNLA